MSAERQGTTTSAPGQILSAFAELRPQLDAGDILLFGGSSRLSQTIKKLTRSRWSHAALVARVGERLLLWEATLDTDLPDVATNEVKPGVNLYDLEGWISHYAGETAIRQLRLERTDAMRQALLAFYEEARGRPYERNRLEVLRAGCRRPRLMNQEPNVSSFFCSELVAEAYQRMGVLPTVPPSNTYTPQDLSSERPTPLPLLLGATLSPEILVCGDGPTAEDAP